jgi:hypothetical protein
VGSLDLPDRPDEPGRAERAGDASAGRARYRETPDPDERGRAFEAARAHVSAETAEDASPGEQPDGTGCRYYWDEVPRFLEAAADNERRWPKERRVTADRSADPPGSYRSDGRSYLNPERHAQATEAVGRVREAEPAISADVKATERENRYGGRLEGFEKRLKGEERLKEKSAEGLATASPDATPDQVLRLIPDAIRYTFCFEHGTYAKGYYDIKERLESRGYEMYYSKNWWTNAEYKGINTRWVTLDGQRFEMQFHTSESFHAKHHVTHGAYERIRDPATSRAELRELHTFQREVSSWIQLPHGATDIPDYKKEGF